MEAYKKVGAELYPLNLQYLVAKKKLEWDFLLMTW